MVRVDVGVGIEYNVRQYALLPTSMFSRAATLVSTHAPRILRHNTVSRAIALSTRTYAMAHPPLTDAIVDDHQEV